LGEMGDFFTVTEYPPQPSVTEDQAKKIPNKLSRKGQKQAPSSDKDIPQEVINDFFKCKRTNHWFYEVLTKACSSRRDPADLCEMWERNGNGPSYAIVDGNVQFLNPKEGVSMEEVSEMMERFHEHLWKSDWFRGLAVPQQQQVAERIQEKSTPSIFSPRKEESVSGDGECGSPPFLLSRQNQTGVRLIKFSTKHGLITHQDSHTGPLQWTSPEPASEKRVRLDGLFSQKKSPMTKERTSLTITPVVGKKEQVIRPDKNENERVPNAESDATTYVFVCLGCRVIMTDLLEVLEHMKTRCMINVKRVESVTQAQEILNCL